jgi:hypothetical protein
VLDQRGDPLQVEVEIATESRGHGTDLNAGHRAAVVSRFPPGPA